MAKKIDPTLKTELEAKRPCISCGIGEMKPVFVFPVTDYSGLRPDGTAYDSIHRTRVQCTHCRLFQIETEYH